MKYHCLNCNDNMDYKFKSSHQWLCKLATVLFNYNLENSLYELDGR